jgi:glycosyltransferase involved in cell wall biosynthesis
MAKPYTIVMLLTNPFKPDPRVKKEAMSLISTGYKVTLICWDRLHEYPQYEIIDQLTVIRVRVKSRYSAGSVQTIFLLLYLLIAFSLIWKIKPDLLHCHDLDTCFTGLIYSKLRKIPWIYDAHECYPEQIGPQVNRFIYKFLLFLERYMVIKADHVITVGNVLAEHFIEFGAKVIIVGNYPLNIFQEANSKEITRFRLHIPENALLVTYVGGFTLARAIVPLVQASNQVNEFYVLLAGDGPQKKTIDKILHETEKVIYLGWIDQSLVQACIEISDIIYYGLNIDDGNSRYSVPNTLFNTMAAGKPILTTYVGEIAKIVKEEECGVIISRPTPEFIIDGIRRLSEKSYRDVLGERGRSAFLRKYNWDIAQVRLLELYSALLN